MKGFELLNSIQKGSKVKERKARVVYVLSEELSEADVIHGIFSRRTLAEARLEQFVKLHSVSRGDLGITEWKINE